MNRGWIVRPNGRVVVPSDGSWLNPVQTKSVRDRRSDLGTKAPGSSSESKVFNKNTRENSISLYANLQMFGLRVEIAK